MRKLLSVLLLLALLTACNPKQDTEKMKGCLTIQDGRFIEYEILVPQNWIANERFEYRKEGNINYFDYNASPKHTLFVIAVFTEAQWKEIQHELKYSKELFFQDGVVFVYNIAPDNPYAGAQADEFQQMVDEVQDVVHSLTVSKISTRVEIVEARKVLIAFFDQLSAGNYAAAAELYGGTYENLNDMNPDIDPGDRSALLERACTVNGFQCLPIRNVVQEMQDWPGIFVFTVEFANPDGSLFVLNTCCGTSGTDTSPQSRFDFRVMRIHQLDNILLVQGLPVYVP